MALWIRTDNYLNSDAPVTVCVRKVETALKGLRGVSNRGVTFAAGRSR
jgi:copper chaperone CopZ